MKTSMRKTALSALAIAFLLSGASAAFASTPSQSLSYTAVGGVANLGNQNYVVAGGQVYFAMIDGYPVNPGASIYYQYYANQNGPSTSGFGSIHMRGTLATPNGNADFTVSGTFSIVSNEGTTQIGAGYLPFYFIASPNIVTTIAGTPTPLEAALAIENPYFNPFGAPVVMVSADSSIVIAATYDVGTITWSGTQLEAQIVSGTLGTTPVSGMMTLTGGEFENLVSGTAVDSGQTSWTGMSPSSLDASGTYHGTDTIPYVANNPDNDCSSYTGIPGATGLCTVTGFQSQGSFRAGDISGTYSTTWETPALAFTTTIQGTVGGSYGGSWFNLFRFL